VGDRPTERACLCALDVDMNPLVVPGRFGEAVDLRLRDDAARVAEVCPEPRDRRSSSTSRGRGQAWEGGRAVDTGIGRRSGTLTCSSRC
jgi:hypothetical protein